MSQQNVSLPKNIDKKDNTQIYVAIIGLIGTIIVAVFGWVNIYTQQKLPLNATMSAEARFNAMTTQMSLASFTPMPTSLVALSPTETSTPPLLLPTGLSGNYMISVPANSAGYPTEILVHRGDILIFSAQGTWCWGGGTDCSSANGTPGRPNTDEWKGVLANDYYGKLIGRVGDWIFPIGISSEVTMLEDGELVLLMNDAAQGDNSGSITVTISRK